MLIVEGSDCLGKTTMIQKMRKMVSHWNPPILYSHMSRPNEDLFDFDTHYVELMTKFTIQDRFHLGGLVYHANRFSKDKLDRVESMLHCYRSLVVVLYTSDYSWYRQRLEADTRGNMLALDTMLAANESFHTMVRGTHPLDPEVDFYFDILDGRYPTDEFIEYVVQMWKATLCA